MVNFDRFCQHASITDADEIYDMAAVRDLSTSNVVFKQICYKQQAKRFPQVKCLREEQKDCIRDSFAVLPTVMSLMNGEAGAVFTIMVACVALEAIMKEQVEQLNTIGVTATAMGID